MKRWFIPLDTLPSAISNLCLIVPSVTNLSVAAVAVFMKSIANHAQTYYLIIIVCSVYCIYSSFFLFMWIQLFQLFVCTLHMIFNKKTPFIAKALVHYCTQSLLFVMRSRINIVWNQSVYCWRYRVSWFTFFCCSQTCRLMKWTQTQNPIIFIFIHCSHWFYF